MHTASPAIYMSVYETSMPRQHTLATARWHTILHTIILLITLTRASEEVRSKRSLPQLTPDAAQTGVWINKGQVYPRCSSLHFQQLQCSNFSLTQPPVPKGRLWNPDCAFLMRRLVCTLYKINCPFIGDSSFQVSRFLSNSHDSCQKRYLRQHCFAHLVIWRQRRWRWWW